MGIEAANVRKSAFKVVAGETVGQNLEDRYLKWADVLTFCAAVQLQALVHVPF